MYSNVIINSNLLLQDCKIASAGGKINTNQCKKQMANSERSFIMEFGRLVRCPVLCVALFRWKMGRNAGTR
jgi:hypothetical protein